MRMGRTVRRSCRSRYVYNRGLLLRYVPRHDLLGLVHSAEAPVLSGKCTGFVAPSRSWPWQREMNMDRNT